MAKRADSYIDFLKWSRMEQRSITLTSQSDNIRAADQALDSAVGYDRGPLPISRNHERHFKLRLTCLSIPSF